MTMPEPFQALAHSLGRLATSAPDQIKYLEALGVTDLVDELALEFDDLYRPRASLVEEASPEAAAACRELDRMLSNDQLGWTFADLESPQWQGIRATAAAAHSALADVPAGGSLC
ncbi:hypothetical protein [Aestuariimicrobium sp. T2.26MG-19.2B]|uniref:hypothetical protein n=1 Tax=Aestuariimicrobium sp. T2.26MG-19.2B TaxID=3040679 RepID=UPI0024774C6E|nr:hypothetical protein [Aestuariimicrobium sp. T2.26MG-19.2B]CAI9409285.1 hypothetical protein AESSP_02206 [Aestuariimicrobium sp. T2.26MG-19.2B]